MGVYETIDRVVFHGVLPGGASPLGIGEQAAPEAGTQMSLPGGLGVPQPAQASPRGRIATLVVRLVPGQGPQLLRVTPGGVALYRRDLAAYKRVQRIARKARPRRYYKKGKR